MRNNSNQTVYMLLSQRVTSKDKCADRARMNSRPRVLLVSRGTHTICDVRSFRVFTNTETSLHARLVFQPYLHLVP